MFGLGAGELIIIAIVALLALGPDKLPGAAKKIGQGIRDLKRQTRDLQQTIEHDTELGDAVRDFKAALRGEDAPPPRPPRPDKGERPIPPAATKPPPAGAEPPVPRPPIGPAPVPAGTPAPPSNVQSEEPAADAEPVAEPVAEPGVDPDTSAHG